MHASVQCDSITQSSQQLCPTPTPGQLLPSRNVTEFIALQILLHIYDGHHTLYVIAQGHWEISVNAPLMSNVYQLCSSLTNIESISRGVRNFLLYETICSIADMSESY